MLAPDLALATAEGLVAPPVCEARRDPRAFYGLYRTDAPEKGSVVLTFDDGPHPKYTPRVLDLLAEHKMTATFFVVGRAISRSTYPLLQRMVAEGHTLGSHSYSHDVTMTRTASPRQTVEAIHGQHEVTAILIDLALMASSAEDFDATYRRVFEADPSVWLAGSSIRAHFREYLGRHRDLLIARGYEEGARPYAVLYSRPPGGGPYVEHDGAAGIKLYDEALTELGMVNVMWHGASGDVDPKRRGDFAYLTTNLEKASKSGGVLLIHDYIRPDALARGLAAMAADDNVRVIPIQEAIEAKYGCGSDALGAQLASAASREAIGRSTRVAADSQRHHTSG